MYQMPSATFVLFFKSITKKAAAGALLTAKILMDKSTVTQSPLEGLHLKSQNLAEH